MDIESPTVKIYYENEKDISKIYSGTGTRVIVILGTDYLLQGSGPTFWGSVQICMSYIISE